MKRILVCEDETAIRELIVLHLERAGCAVVQAGSGEEALRLFEELHGAFDIAVLDVMLPGIDGFAVCRDLRARSETLGIIMLTARAQEMEKVSGLMMGADDYITKPFSPTELVARIDALYRRLSSQTRKLPREELRQGDFVLNVRSHVLYKKGQPFELTQVEFQILQLFFTNPDKAITRNEILDCIWGKDYYGDDKIVDVNIRRLRMKIEDNPAVPTHICTVWGTGYRWKAVD